MGTNIASFFFIHTFQNEVDDVNHEVNIILVGYITTTSGIRTHGQVVSGRGEKLSMVVVCIIYDLYFNLNMLYNKNYVVFIRFFMSPSEGIYMNLSHRLIHLFNF